jgi:hypothetical protein
MNAQLAERAIQLLSVLGVWLAFLAGRGVRAVQLETYEKFGADLPPPTLWWLDMAGSLWTLAIPAAGTLLVFWLMRRRSAHANWTAGVVLAAGLGYALFTQAAALLPYIKPCAAV